MTVMRAGIRWLVEEYQTSLNNFLQEALLLAAAIILMILNWMQNTFFAVY
jgi:hypothetical protein